MAHRIEVRSGAREQLLDITDRVAAVVRSSGVADGVVHLFALHTTCGLTVNEGYDPDVAGDMVRFMSHMVPVSPAFRHAEGNSDSHIKTSLSGTSVTLLIEDGELLLGQWQRVFLAEWDGPREREIAIVVQRVDED